MTSEDALWYKDAIIYELHVRCFYDSDGNGIGDFAGLTKKLDYLQDLGVTAIWLLPFYPSPLKDDGYDIADYMDIHSSYGTLHDFKIFLKEAHKRGLKVITELVINHTSDQHPWFQRARYAPSSSRYRDYYVWNDSQNKYSDARIIFQDFENSNWSWDPIAKSYYWHRFYSHQPDLNYENPEVRKQIERILSFWLKLGVDGVRLDAVPYLFEKEGTNCENLAETHEYLKELRKYVDDRFKNRMFLAEANQWPEDAAKYFGGGDECQMAFHFPVMPRLFMAIHLEDSLPIIEILSQTPSIPDNCQWALFLRNHDELTLEMVTDEERDYMFRVYAYDPQARINLGIRRRLAPLLKNDRRKIELMNSLLFSLTGTPVIYYGDEIGMGDNIYLGDRNGVRTPMQWSNDRNAGFSLANPQRLYLPPIVDPEYHFETVNVEAQQNNPYSLLWWTKQLIALRKRFKAFGYGATQFIKPDNRKVLVFMREYQDEIILIVSNLSRFSQYVELDLSKYQGYHPMELFSGGRFPDIGELPYFLTLGPYGYYWFALVKDPKESFGKFLERQREKQILTFSYKKGGEEIFHKEQKRTLDAVLRSYLVKRVWFQKSLLSVDRTKSKIVDQFIIHAHSLGRVHLVILQLTFTNGVVERYPFFLHYLNGEAAEKKKQESPERVLVQFASKGVASEVGILYDVSEEREVFEIFLHFIDKQRRLKGECGELHGVSYAFLSKDKPHFLDLGKEKTIHREANGIHFPTEKGNLKIFSVVEEEMDCDIEVRSMLTQHTSFRGFPPLLGFLRYKMGESITALAAEFADFPEEYNAMALAMVEAEHFFLAMEAEKSEIPEKVLLPLLTLEPLAHQPIQEKWVKFFQGYPKIVEQLGEMTAEMQVAFGSITQHKNFEPQPYTLFYQRSLYQTLRRRIQEGFAVLKNPKINISNELKEELQKVIGLEEGIMNFLNLLTHFKISGFRIRVHGKYRLENLFYTGKQFLISDFSGQLKHTYTERKYKRSPLVDVATMLLSFANAGFKTSSHLKTQGMLNSHDWKTLAKWSMSWSLWIGSRFLKAYLDKLQDIWLLPEDAYMRDYLIGVFLIEKCLDQVTEEGAKEHPSLEVPLYMLYHVATIYYRRFLKGEGR